MLRIIHYCFVLQEHYDYSVFLTIVQYFQGRTCYDEISQKLCVCGPERNSYSRTDRDATFMRMKRDYMGNDQLLPAYNVQIGVADEYIAVMDVQQYRSDMDCFVPLLERFRIQYGFYPGYPVADAGYGSYNNYLYCRDHEMELFMKFPMYEKETKDRKYSTDPFRAVNFQTNEQGELICPNSRRMQFSCRKAVKGNHYGRIVTSAFLGMAPSYRANLKETVKTAKKCFSLFSALPGGPKGSA